MIHNGKKINDILQDIEKKKQENYNNDDTDSEEEYEETTTAEELADFKKILKHRRRMDKNICSTLNYSQMLFFLKN